MKLTFAIGFITFALATATFGATPANPRIIDGNRISASALPMVAKITSPTPPFFLGTGTLISPRHVLTAMHVVTDGNGVFNLTTTNKVLLGGIHYDIFLCHFHPTYTFFRGDLEDQFDVAILELVGPVQGITPTPINRIEPQVGQMLTIAGFGSEGTGTIGNIDYPPEGVLNFGQTPIDSITPTFIKWNFDSILESSTAQGDSGGPAFIQRGNVLYLAASTSGGTGTGLGNQGTGYGNRAFDVRTDRVADWVDRTCMFTDLTAASGLSIPATVRTGQAVSITTNVTNNGFVNAQPFVVTYRLSVDPVYDANDPIVGESFLSNGLAFQTQNQASSILSIPSVPTGNYFLVWNIDETGAVFQSDLTNDRFFVPIQIIANQAPLFSSPPIFTPQQAIVNQPVSFNSTSIDPDNDQVVVNWDFGDGISAVGSNVEHLYTVTGTYTVVVTLSDPFGGKTSISGSIVVSNFLSVFPPTPNPAIVGQKINFKAIANVSDQKVTYKWNFGDGPFSNATVATPTYVYVTPGVYTVKVSASANPTGIPETAEFSITVGDGFAAIPTGQTVLPTFPSGKFKLNFKSSFKDTFSVSLSGIGKFSDKKEFFRATDRKKLSIFFGESLYDTVELTKGKGLFGKGKIAWSSSLSTLKYSLKGQNLRDLFQQFGATNETISKRITIPFFVEIGGVKFGKDFTFSYVGISGRTGSGSISLTTP